MTASLDDLEVAPVGTRLKPILRYVRKLTETPNRMTAADAAAVYDAGWSDEALLHAIAVCAYFNNMNRLVEGAGIVAGRDDYAAAARNLFEQGYLRKNGGKRPAARAAGRSKRRARGSPGARPR